MIKTLSLLKRDAVYSDGRLPKFRWNPQIKVKWSRYRPGVAQRVGRGIALLFHDRGTRRRWVFSSTPRPHFTTGKDPVPTLQEAVWAPRPVWTGGKFRPHRDSIPDRPARSQSLYRLNYRGPRNPQIPCQKICSYQSCESWFRNRRFGDKAGRTPGDFSIFNRHWSFKSPELEKKAVCSSEMFDIAYQTTWPSKRE